MTYIVKWSKNPLMTYIFQKENTDFFEVRSIYELFVPYNHEYLLNSFQTQNKPMSLL